MTDQMPSSTPADRIVTAFKVSAADHVARLRIDLATLTSAYDGLYQKLTEGRTDRAYALQYIADDLMVEMRVLTAAADATDGHHLGTQAQRLAALAALTTEATAALGQVRDVYLEWARDLRKAPAERAAGAEDMRTGVDEQPVDEDPATGGVQESLPPGTYEDAEAAQRHDDDAAHELELIAHGNWLGEVCPECGALVPPGRELPGGGIIRAAVDHAPGCPMQPERAGEVQG